MTLTFNNRLAVVTGAGRGIGRGIAEALASSGVEVVCVSKNESSCGAAAEAIRRAGHNAHHYAVDVADPGAVKAACTEIIKDHKEIDILVNNAGINRDNLMLRMTDDEWNAVIDTNLSSCFHWTRGVLRGMARQRWGRIINVSSVVGIIGNPGQVNYAAAKAGIIGMTKASRSITVNAIAPGFINTDMTEAIPEEARKEAAKMIPLKRFGCVSDISTMANYLASEEAGYITGQTLAIDGGMAM